MFKRLRTYLLLIIGLSQGYLQAAPAQWCKDAIAGYVKTGPGWGFLYYNDIQKEVAEWAAKGLTGSGNSVFIGNTYICDSCSRPNGSKDRQGKFTNCKGCSHPIDKNTMVHKLFTKGGIRLAHIDSVFYGGESLGDLVATPWNCTYCTTKNEASQTQCKSCGADPYAGHPKDFEPGPIPHGIELVLIPDSSEFDGYRLEPRVGTATLAMQKTGRLLARAAGPAAPYIQGMAQRAAPYVAPVAARASSMSLRQRIGSGVIAATLLTGITWWSLQPYVPDLPSHRTVSGVITFRSMHRGIQVRDRNGLRLPELEPRANDYQADSLEGLTAPEIVDWPTLDPTIAQNTREYRSKTDENYYAVVQTGEFVATLPMAPMEIKQWRVGDRVKLTIAEGGAEIGIQRELP